jgi:Fe-S cluster assembly protein SufD
MAAAIALFDRDQYRRDFANFVATRNEPQTMLERRRQALKRYESLGIPASRWEAWRFTDINALAQTSFSRSGNVPIEAALLPKLEGHCHRLVFVNGRFVPSLSRLDAFPAKAMMASLGQALLTHPELVEAHLDCLPGLEEHPFVALNSAFWEDGAFVYLPKGVVLDYPLHLICYASGADTVNYPRVLIILEEASQATIVEDFRGDGQYLTCPLTEIELAAGAVLEHYKVQEESLQAWHLGGLRLRQDRDSRLQGQLLSNGGLLVRTDIFALLDGEGAECQLSGLTLVGEGQLGDQHLRVEHAKPHGTSRQLFKAVLQGKSRTVFDGLIHVHKNAQKTDASQTNRNLLLSKLALANSNPRLEILADDVKCSHGSSTGFLDQDALFYLRSRGIGEAEAHAMLVYAFANDIVERIRLNPLRQRLEELLAQRLNPDAVERKSA